MKNDSEAKFLEHLTSLCGKENFRPKLDHIRDYLLVDRREIEAKSKIIIVGGTNGKGETCHSLNYLFNRASRSNCMWTSPHVLSITERFKLNDHNISIDELWELLKEFEKDIIELGLSFYEALFVLFIKYVRSVDVEFVILEVGLGGRFDATNIFTRPIAAITSIGLDHTQILGSTLKEILFEKYGISRISGKLFENIDQQFLKDILGQWCKRDFVDLVSVSVPQTNLYFERNREMAKALFKQATGEAIEDEANIVWPISIGRGDVIKYGGVEFKFIGAHNHIGHKELLKSLNSAQDIGTYDVLMSFSQGREDQVKSILKLYRSYPCIVKSVNVLCFNHDRALSKNTLEQTIGSSTKVYEIHDFLDTILGINDNIESDENNKNKTDSNKKLVVGSYYFIAAVQQYLLSLSN